jgi:hypothetical protein
MITKKLAVPLINEKILQQAEHCYIATSSISDEGFEFIRTRISPTCKIDIVTGLDEPTSPDVLFKIIRHYQGRINLHIYTRSTLHANLYVFDLPFRKSVAFVGSGNFSLEGFKDNEELFWRITNPKEIESLMSWYTSYLQFGVPLDENIVNGYREIYRGIKKREIRSRKEKEGMFALCAKAFSWDAIKFRTQYFKKEDYLVLSNANAPVDNAALRMSRTALKEKLDALEKIIEKPLAGLKLRLVAPERRSISPMDHFGQQVRELWLVYSSDISPCITLEAGIAQKDVIVRAHFTDNTFLRNERRQYFDEAITSGNDLIWCAQLLRLKGYLIEVSGITKPIDIFQTEKSLLEFFAKDAHHDFDINIEKRFTPGDSLINEDNIADTIRTEIVALVSALQVAPKKIELPDQGVKFRRKS